MQSLHVFVRTCKSRRSRAFLLADTLRECLGLSRDAFCVLESLESPYFSQDFLLGICKHLNTRADWVLIVEDDIVFSPRVKTPLIEAMNLQTPAVWFTMESDRVLNFCDTRRGALLDIKASVLAYSGAVLVQTCLLRRFCEETLFTFLERDSWKFDTSLSSFLCRERGGRLWVAPGFFATSLEIPSLLNNSGFGGPTRQPTKPTQDFWFDFSTAIP